MIFVVDQLSHLVYKMSGKSCENLVLRCVPSLDSVTYKVRVQKMSALFICPAAKVTRKNSVATTVTVSSMKHNKQRKHAWLSTWNKYMDNSTKKCSLLSL